MWISRRKRWALLSAALAVVAALGYLLGVHNTENANWHEVTVDLAGVAAEEDGTHRQISIEADGWTYGIEDSVAWVDAQGAFHEGGWPECLEPSRPGFPMESKKVTLRFAELTVEADSMGWRPVVLVDCGSG